MKLASQTLKKTLAINKMANLVKWNLTRFYLVLRIVFFQDCYSKNNFTLYEFI